MIYHRKRVDDSGQGLKQGGEQCSPFPKQPIELPVELWWKVIDFTMGDFLHLENGGIRLQELATVCWTWYARCHSKSLERIDIVRRDKKQAYRLVKILNEQPERYKVIKRVNFANNKINMFGSLAICMAGKLPRVEILRLEDCAWVPGQLHWQVFLHVNAAFGSITRLHLLWVSFPSATVFGRFICALPRLVSLKCRFVRLKRDTIVANNVLMSSFPRLDAIDLYGSSDVADFLIATRASTYLRHVTFSGPDAREGCSTLIAITADPLSSLHFKPEMNSFEEDTASGQDLLPDLTPAVNLRLLSVFLDGFDADWSFHPRWLADALPPASLPKLAEIEIIVRPRDKDKCVQGSFDDVSDDAYAQIDRILSGRQFPALRKITFHLRCTVRRSVVMKVLTAESWKMHLSSKLPTLYASGRLFVQTHGSPSGLNVDTVENLPSGEVSVLEASGQPSDVLPKYPTQLPVELWLTIIDLVLDHCWHSWDYQDQLQKLSMVCQGWLALCRFRAREKVDVEDLDKKGIFRLIKGLEEYPERYDVIKTVSFWNPYKIDVLGSFAVRMARKLPRVATLNLVNCDWVSGKLHPQIFLHMNATFGSISTLELVGVSFPSAAVFGRLIGALCRLSILKCFSVKFAKYGIVADTVRESRTPTLVAAYLDQSSSVMEFLGMVSIGAHLHHLSFDDSDREKGARMVAAAGESLSSLDIQLQNPIDNSNNALPDLTPAVKLSALLVDLDLKDLGWLANILSHASLPKLVELQIVIKLDAREGEHVLDVLDKIEYNCCERIDQVLSTRQYPALKT
ncbi:uncharacterized protein FIBRA_02496 [Fibroporia radiculosa]|uniref:F-box domain-containing protein n=1 Tax=Fibroporia radiculosa TaxID=599839 RepID=J4G1Q5_9APHY|nr:uncharacterized protein FIBRA_02496 [Fibroporia radiculosa]CCM00463.1 predicted protein [Fibroporia radiculosa]